MLKKITIIWLLVTVAGFFSVQAQDVRVQASVDRNKILIGEPIQLRLDVEIPQGTPMGWFNLDTIPHFTFITRNKIDTQNNVRTILFKQILSITSFDSGQWVIPQLGLTVGNNRYLTDSISIMVDYSPAAASSSANVKTYFTRLNDILRTYFKNRNLVTAPNAGNESFVQKVQSDLSRDQVLQLAQTLRLTDAVKFAKYNPSAAEQEEAYDVIRKTLPIIDEIHYKNPGS